MAGREWRLAGFDTPARYNGKQKPHTMEKDLLLTLYARYERSIEGTASARDRDVTLWRKAKPSDFPHMTRKLIQEGPRLADGSQLFPVARIPYYHSNKPTKRNRSTMLNCWRWHLEWID